MSRLRAFFLLLILFILNPFCAFCVSLIKIRNCTAYVSIRSNYNLFLIVISLFLGVLAYTQYTTQGDIIRTYESIILDAHVPELLTIDFGSSIFKIINVFIYNITGNVQYTSLFWVFLIYYLSLLSIVNIIEYKEKSTGHALYDYVCALIFCFIIFTQVTELMKQAVAAALFFYSFTSIINRRLFRGGLCLLLSLGIHASSFFYFPLLLAFFIKKSKYLCICAILSFLFRGFNLMEFVATKFRGLTIFSSIVDRAELYSEEHMENFFRADSLYFVTLFTFFVFFVSFIYLASKNKNSIFLKLCIIMIIVLNLNHGVSHNFTRMLTMLFPFYLMIFSELDDVSDKYRVISQKVFLFSTFVFSLVMMSSRLSSTSSYGTSFMDNSLLKILISPLYLYLTTITF